MSVSNFGTYDSFSGANVKSAVFTSYQNDNDKVCECYYFSGDKKWDADNSTVPTTLDLNPGFTSGSYAPVDGPAPTVGSGGPAVCVTPAAAGDTLTTPAGAFSWDTENQECILTPIISVEDPANPGQSLPQTITATLSSGTGLVGPTGSVTIDPALPPGTEYVLKVDLATAPATFIPTDFNNITYEFSDIAGSVCIAGFYMVSSILSAFGALNVIKAKCVTDISVSREQDITEKTCKGVVFASSVTSDSVTVTFDVTQVDAFSEGVAGGAAYKTGKCWIASEKEITFTDNGDGTYTAPAGLDIHPTMLNVGECETIRNYTSLADEPILSAGTFHYDAETGNIITSDSSVVQGSNTIRLCFEEEKTGGYLIYKALEQGSIGSLQITDEGDKTTKVQIFEKAQANISNRTGIAEDGDTYQFSFNILERNGALWKTWVEEKGATK